MSRLTSYGNITALITGASSGIGRVLALRFVDEGARVALAACRVERLEELAREIETRGREALVLPCDVADREQVFAAARTAVDHFCGVDLLVNNAADGHHRPFLDWDLDDMKRTTLDAVARSKGSKSRT